MRRLRAIRVRNPEQTGKKGYAHSWKFEGDDGHLWTLDLFGSLLSKPAEARDAEGASAWSTLRNRMFFPSAWHLTDASGRSSGALTANWLSRKGWRAQTADGEEAFSLKDPRKGFEYVFDLPGGPGDPDWLVTRGERAIGWLNRVECREKPKGRGPLKGLAKLALPLDWLMEIADPAETPDPRLMALAILMVEEVTRKLDSTAS